jgi:bifunctional non-homologous end joining protein LigD
MNPIAPMLATLVDAPFHRDDWVYEEKYDGIRALAYRRNGEVQLLSRNLIERTKGFPHVVHALQQLVGGDFILDGELVTLDAQGVSRFQLWQQGGSVRFAVFDCLMRDGVSLVERPLKERRAAVEALVPAHDTALLRARRLEGDGLAAYRFAKDSGWEGIIAKDEGAPYEPGKRSASWLKVKVRKESELVIGGFTPPRKSRAELGALMVGLYDDDGEHLRYCGKVGTGFTLKTLQELGAQLRRLQRASSPFAPVPKEKGATWVEPRLVAQLAFHEWTGDGKLRHPAFLGLRDDKDPRQCRWSERER